MARVGRESEEVAYVFPLHNCVDESAVLIRMYRFYNGGQRERSILWRAYLRLISHINRIYKVGTYPTLRACDLQAVVDTHFLRMDGGLRD